jgi:hypothetical protein
LERVHDAIIERRGKFYRRGHENRRGEVLGPSSAFLCEAHL